MGSETRFCPGRYLAWAHSVALAGAVTCAALTLGCAAKQAIPLHCIPEEVVVYVDGELLEEHPDVLELSVNEPHKLYFTRPGHEPQLIVLHSRASEDGRAELTPADVCVELTPVGLGRELTIEIDPDATP